jgi:hypothetical protein
MRVTMHQVEAVAREVLVEPDLPFNFERVEGDGMYFPIGEAILNRLLRALQILGMPNQSLRERTVGVFFAEQTTGDKSPEEACGPKPGVVPSAQRCRFDHPHSSLDRPRYTVIAIMWEIISGNTRRRWRLWGWSRRHLEHRCIRIPVQVWVVRDKAQPGHISPASIPGDPVERGVVPRDDLPGVFVAVIIGDLRDVHPKFEACRTGADEDTRGARVATQGPLCSQEMPAIEMIEIAEDKAAVQGKVGLGSGWIKCSTKREGF